MFYIYRWLGRHRDALVFAEHEKMKHSLSPLSDPIEVLSFFFRSVSGDVGLEFTLIASGSYHIGSSFNRVTSLIKFQIMHVKIIELDQNLSFMKMKWLHRCWRRMLETKCVGDKFEMLVTDSGCWRPIS